MKDARDIGWPASAKFYESIALVIFNIGFRIGRKKPASLSDLQDLAMYAAWGKGSRHPITVSWIAKRPRYSPYARPTLMLPG